jgi:hypothetical protein
MTRALTISLLLIFLADAVGCILYLLVDWYEVKKEMTHFLASDEFEKSAITLTLDKDEVGKIRWIESDHEFYYMGKLYDIASLTQIPDHKTKIRCVEDQHEAEFFQYMEQMVDHGPSDHNHQRTFILSVFKFLSGLIFQLFAFPIDDNSLSAHSSAAYINRYHFSFNANLLQPPDTVSFSI